jgi:hypothetical protein
MAGYFTRVKNSFAGFLVGIALFIGAIPLLAWNENNVYKVRMGLKEGAELVRSVEARPSSELEGQLVHVSGTVSTAAGVKDPVFQIGYDVLRLQRTVEMYQWDEKRSKQDDKTRYSYHQKWSERHIDSSRFNDSNNHRNPPPPPYSSDDFIADDGRLGEFAVSESQIRAAGGLAPIAEAAVPPALRNDGWRGHGSTWFKGRGSLDSPDVGDLRISFTVLPEGTLSLVGQQQGKALVPWTSSRDTEVMLVERGAASAPEMFEAAQSRNNLFGWAMRAAGFAAMWIGLGMCFQPLASVLSFIPGVGGLVRVIGKWLTFLIAMLFAVTTIVLSWIAVRPLILVMVLAGIVAVALIIGRMRGEAAPQAATARPGATPPPPPMPPPMAPPPPPR